MLSRRDLVGRLAAGAAGAVVFGSCAGRATAAVALSEAQRPSGRDDAVDELRAAAEIVQEAPQAAEEAPSSTATQAPWELLGRRSRARCTAGAWLI
jgi:hypothetical protein